MALTLERYLDQQARWPTAGRHILARYDEASVVVYQAYRPAIGHYAARHGRFGGEVSLDRMSWIKPNFLWMMYRCGWGTKDGQEVTLAVWLRRAALRGDPARGGSVLIRAGDACQLRGLAGGGGSFVRSPAMGP
jgi:hypothetical protein